MVPAPISPLNLLTSESFSLEETQFIAKKLNQQRAAFWVATRTMILLGTIILGITMLLFKMLPLEETSIENKFEVLETTNWFYVIVAFIFFLIIGGASIFSYRKTVHRLALDYKEQIKLIECTNVNRKVYMPHTKSYHFYLQSPSKLSIEVSARDYHDYKIGDEINIEYSKNAKEYFGYF